MMTLADRIREARGATGIQGVVAMMAENESPPALSPDPREGLPADVAAHIVTHGGPVDPGNPSARCDYCPRTTAADMLVEVEPGRYACDVCQWRWEREGRSD